MKRILLIASVLFFSFAGIAQDHLNVEIESGTIVSSGDVVPLWFRSNNFGIYDWDKPVQSQLFGKVYYEKEFNKYLKIKAGASGILKTNIDSSFVHEAFINLKTIYNIELKVGQEAWSPLDENESLGSGHFLMSNNARPFPKVGLGIFEYTDIAFTKGYLQVRGGVFQGILLDDRGTGVDSPLMHEKYAYISTNKLPVNLSAGLTHIALFGGTMADGREIPVDYLSVFLTKGSDAVGEVLPGEAINVAGGHIGNFDFGARFNLMGKGVEISLQKMFEDGSGVRGYFNRNKDFLFRVKVDWAEHGFLTRFVYERIKTDWQSGPGNHTAVVDGKIVILSEIDDFDAYVLEHFDSVTSGIDVDEFNDILQEKVNYGFTFGGRDNYYNNGVYKGGYTNFGYTMGTPFFHTTDMLNVVTDEQFNGWFIYNSRIVGHHLGIEGEMSRSLKYRLKYSLINNLGNYSDVARDGTINPESYFYEGKIVNYLSLELTKDFEHLPIQIIGAFGADFGEIYNSYGAQLKLRYRL